MKRNLNKKISRRDFIKTTSTVAAGIALSNTVGLSKYAHASVKPIKIGVIAPSHCALSMVSAHINGTYRKNGVNAEIVFLPQTSDIAKGLITGELQVGQLISPVFFALNAGCGPFEGNATPVVCAQTAGTNGGVLIRATNSDIKLPADLKGKNIGVHSPLMVHTLLFKTLLARYNLNPEKDINIKVINMKDLIPALKKGEIDAFINPEPLATFSEVKGVGDEMMLSKNLWLHHPCCLTAMKKELYNKDKDLAKAIYASNMENALLLDNPATRHDAIEKVHKDSQVYNKVPLAGLQKAFKPWRSDFDSFVYQSSGRAVMGMMQDFGQLPESIDIDTLASKTLLSDLSRELLVSVGGTPPAMNDRPEKIVGMMVTS